MHLNQSKRRHTQKFFNSISANKGLAAISAAAAALGSAQVVSAASAPDGTVTFVMSLNDDGFGDFTPNSFAIYAIDGTVTGTTVTPNSVTANSGGKDGGIDNFFLPVNNAIAGTLNDDIYNGSTYAAYQNGNSNNVFVSGGLGQLQAAPFYDLQVGTKRAQVSVGFVNTSFHQDTNTTVGAGQNTAGVVAPSVANTTGGVGTSLVIFGVGQTASDMANFANKTTGNNPGTPTGTTQNNGNKPFSMPFAGPGTFTYGGGTYLSSVLIADGQYVTGTPPTINIASSTVGLFAAYDEPIVTNGYTGAGSSTVVAVLTQTLTNSVPEPASLGLLTAGASGLLAQKRRKILPPL